MHSVTQLNPFAKRKEGKNNFVSFPFYTKFIILIVNDCCLECSNTKNINHCNNGSHRRTFQLLVGTKIQLCWTDFV
jgi:hypothetical protein